MERTIDEVKASLIVNINKRVTDKVIEKQNADTLIRFINTAQTIDDANFIYTVGTKYKSTGFHFDFRKDKIDNDTIYYFQKNQKLSFQPTNKNGLTHKLVIGDNYKALLNLLIEYRGKIDVIYIDPPYGVNSMGEFADTNYENNISRDNLLSMLQTRLLIAKELLSDSGVIFCSIDDKNQAYVKCLFDDVFGEENFLTMFVRKTKSMTGDDGNGLNIQHEYLLTYAKYKAKMTFIGDVKTFDAYSNPDNDSNGIWTSADPSAKSGSESTYFPIENPITGQIDYPPKGRYWAFSKETLKMYIDSGRIKFKTTITKNQRGFTFKRYAESMQITTEVVNTLCFDNNIYMNSAATAEINNIVGAGNVSYPKPVEYIKDLIKFTSNKNSVVLDFFAGSGTTGQAVMELNKSDGGQRKFVLVQLPETLDKNSKNSTIKNAFEFTQKYKLDSNLASITAARLKRVMTGNCYDGSTDFKWNEKNTPYGDGLDVYNIASVSAMANQQGQMPFNVIDETLYGKEKLNINDKID
ncbi:MAG: site-specific DNA-methyltransferase, partial [Clostridia bacterium]|nr:site-specific DNA-methyltransferase [Clostridia bacterium]